MIPINKISKELVKNKWIDSVKIQSNFKNSLKIFIVESKPVGIYFDKNDFFLFNNKGKIISSIKNEDINFNKLNKLEPSLNT